MLVSSVRSLVSSCASRSLGSRIVVTALGAALVTASMSPIAVSAQDVPAAEGPGLTPIADILSASSWLLVSGQDPRYGATVDLVWYDTPSTARGQGAEVPLADTPGGDQIVTENLGLVPVHADPSLAVDPRDPEHLILAVNALDLPGIATYTSVDGGETWQGPNQAPYFAGDSGSAGSPALAFGRDGMGYLVSQTFHAAPQSLAGSVPAIDRSRIAVSISEDGGLKWGEPVSLALTSIDIATVVDQFGTPRVDVLHGFLDRPAIALGPAARRPEREAIYVAYTDFQLRSSVGEGAGTTAAPATTVESTIRLVRSTDGGQKWSNPVAVSPTASRFTEGASGAPPRSPEGPTMDPAASAPVAPEVGGGTASDRVVQGAQVAVLSDGTVLVAYLDTTEDGPHQGLARIMVTVSEDGGRQFSEPVQAGLFLEVYRQPRTAFFPWWGTSFPRLVIGPEDEVYIAATARPGDRPADDADIALLRSLDGGLTWQSLPIAGANSAGSQFFPALAIARDGTLVALWADTRDDSAGVSYALHGAASGDGGQTWRGLGAEQEADVAMNRLSGEASNALLGFPGGRYLGDQFAVAVGDMGIYGAWATTRLASDAPNLQIAVGRHELGNEDVQPGDDG